MPAGATLVSGVLSLFPTSLFNQTGGDPFEIDLRGYAGDGTVQLADFYGATVVSGPFTVADGATPLHRDVTSFIDGLLGESASYAGFMIRMSAQYLIDHQNVPLDNAILSLGSANQTDAALRPVLTLQFTEGAPVPEPSFTLMLGAMLAGVALCRRRSFFSAS